MEGADENPEKFNLSLNTTTNSSRDLLKRFRHQIKEEEGDDDDELELGLGLSLNGIFGVDPTSKKLKRSSSIANLPFTVVGAAADDEGSSRGDVAAAAFEGHALPIFRTSSLPIQGQGKGKELVSMKQMEARKKRMEKLKNVRLVNKDKENGGGGAAAADFFSTNTDNDDNKKDGLQVHEGAVAVQNLDAEVLDLDGFENGLPSSQGSIGSQGSGGSSGFSDHQSQQQIEEVRQTTEVKSSSGHQALQSQVEQKSAPGAGAGAGAGAVIMDADAANKLFKMPYVSLKGSGGNGRKTEGFLYRYNKGEEVKIVCVCHGLFLSPAEFVKHGGGGDVEYPLKHIVVNPSPLF